MSVDVHDVVILGGGMAGLTLAQQLRQRAPELDIIVLEHRSFPAPEAAFKVGESTVEIAAHYLSNVLGLGEHLRGEQLPKFGLRLFCRGETAIVDDLSEYDEIGVSRLLPIPTYQIDRGRLENALAHRCAEDGIRIEHETTVTDFSLDGPLRRVTTRRGEFLGRYLVDATGRRAMLRRGLGLERDVRHRNEAVWFRVSGAVDIDAMSNNSSWLARCEGTPRRLSTNHFTGPGYWVWVIPLASNATSIGVVFDPSLLARSQVATHSAFMRWLAAEHPLLAVALEGAELMDFHRMDGYSVGCRQTFSEEGWMITGDAGNFADPFYSPGGDFIALGNTFITDLITSNAPPSVWQQHQSNFNAFYASTIGLYRGLYGGFGHRDFMVAKTIWDYAYYWGVLSKLYFSGRMLDTRFMLQARQVLQKAYTMNGAVQQHLRRLAASSARVGGTGRFYDHHDIGFFHEWKQDLLTGAPELDGERLRCNVATLAEVKCLVEQIIAAAGRNEAALRLGDFDSRMRATVAR